MPIDHVVQRECTHGSSPPRTGLRNLRKRRTAIRRCSGWLACRQIVLLWAEEGKYRKIVAIRVEDSGDAGPTPSKTMAAPPVSAAEPEKIAGDPDAVKAISSFY